MILRTNCTLFCGLKGYQLLCNYMWVRIKLTTSTVTSQAKQMAGMVLRTFKSRDKELMLTLTIAPNCSHHILLMIYNNLKYRRPSSEVGNFDLEVGLSD